MARLVIDLDDGPHAAEDGGVVHSVLDDAGGDVEKLVLAVLFVGGAWPQQVRSTTPLPGLIDAKLATHRAMLDRPFNAGAAGRPTGPGGSPAMVRLGAPIVHVPLSIDGRVAVGPGLGLADGTSTRWAGNSDLLHLVELANEPTPRVLLVARLQALKMAVPAGRALVAWAVSNGVLTDATRQPWLPSPG